MATFKPVVRKQTRQLPQRVLRSPGRALPPRGLLAPEAFQQALRIERRRTERSGRAFALILISDTDFRANPTAESAESVAAALGTCIRETDVLGWYERHISIGFLMTEIGEHPFATVEVIVHKLSDALQN